MSGDIKHYGIVEEVKDGCIKVRIVQTSACATCKIAGHCTASESKEKLVDVYGENKSNLKTGDEVVVVASQNVGFLAVLLSAVIPLFILVAALAAGIYLTGDEALGAIVGIASLAPYFFIIYALREKIRNKLSFHIQAA